VTFDSTLEKLKADSKILDSDGSDGATTLSIMTFSIMALSIKGLYVTLSINNTQHK
jgi:hypothetical protein